MYLILLINKATNLIPIIFLIVGLHMEQWGYLNIYVRKYHYNLIIHACSIFICLINRLGVRDLEEKWLRIWKSIWKSHYTWKHGMWLWHMIQQGLTFESRAHKFGVTNVACAFCARDEMIEHVFWRCLFSKTFRVWVKTKFNFFIIASLF